MVFVLIIVAAYALGHLCLARFRAASNLEHTVFAVATGLSLCAVLTLVAGSHSLQFAQVLLGLIAFSGLLVFLRKGKRNRSLPGPPEENKGLSWFDTACLMTTAFALFFASIGTMAPLTSWDATVAHLALPSDYAREGHIFLHPGNVYSGYPHFMHTLLAVAYYPEFEKPAMLLSWALATLACLAVYLLGRRVHSQTCGFIAAAIFATAPIFADQAGGISIDLPFVAFATLALAALIAWFDEQKTGWLLLAGFLAGSSCGIRHTGYIVCVLLAMAVFLGQRDHRLRATILFSLLVLVGAGPWLLRSALLVHNPFFPLFAQFFPESPIDHIAITEGGAHETVSTTGGFSIITLLQFPYDIIMRPERYDGWTKSPGVLVLALGIPGLFLSGKRARRLALYSLAGIVIFFFFQRFARYLLPFFVPMMVVAAMATLDLKKGRPIIQLILLGCFAFGLVFHAGAIHFKVPVVLGRETRQDYLHRRVERYRAFEYANEHLTDGAVYSIDQRTYYIKGPSWQNHWTLQKLMTMTTEEQHAWLLEHDIKYVMVPRHFTENSGVLREFIPMFDQWKQADTLFRLEDTLEFPNVRSEGFEQVEIYEVLVDESSSS